MIAENTIEQVLAHLENGSENLEAEIAAFASEQPYLMDYLANEDVEAFTESERDLLLFAALVIYRSVIEDHTQPMTINGSAIAEAEEANYALMTMTRGDFRDRLTPFFEQSPEEDLLAFIEDLIVAEDETDAVTQEAREPFFVTLKTLVDVLTAQPQSVHPQQQNPAQ